MNRRKRKSHYGGVLVLVLVAVVMLLGMAALAIDISMLYAARRRAQAVADATALAAGPLLPSTSIATAKAQLVAATNSASGVPFTVTGITFSTSSQSTVTLDDGTTVSVAPGDAVTVTGYVDAPLSFAPILGYGPTSRDGKTNTQSVTASATIFTTNACSLPAGVGMAPFGVVADDPNSSDPDVAYMSQLLTTAQNSQTPLPNTYQPISKQIPLKVSTWQNGTMQSGGDFGALALTGNGANAYKSAISATTTQGFYVGEQIATKPGNMVGPTQQGMTNRLDPTNTAFTHRYSTYVDWFFGNQTLPIDSTYPPVTDGSNTYYYRQDPHRQELTDARVMILPLISQPSKNGKANAVILAFGVFFVESTGASVNGRFVSVMIPNSGGGGCAGAGSMLWPRLAN